MLAPTGRIETAIFWKNLILAGWRSTFVMLMFAVVIGAAVAGGSGAAAPLQTAGIVCTTLATIVIFLGPTMIRNDLRTDLAYLAVLKTWPASGAAIVRGEILTPAVLLSLLSSALLACGAAFSGGAVLDFIHWSGASRVSFAVSAIVVASAILTAHLVVHNAVAVMFPAWVRIGARAAPGVEMMGQNMLVMAGAVIVLAAAVAPAALAAVVAVVVMHQFAGSVPLVVPAALFAGVLLLECLAAAGALGRVLDATDVNAMERPE